MRSFVISDEFGTTHYYMSTRNYCYASPIINGIVGKVRRVSSSYYLSRYEEYMNY